MSNRQPSRSREVAHLIAEVKRMTPEQLLETYGIELLDKGKVFDTTYEQEFKSVADWASWSVNQDGFDFYDDLADKYEPYKDEEY